MSRSKLAVMGLVLGVAALVAGCRSQIEYPLQKRAIYSTEMPAHTLKVAVAVFADERPAEERDVKARTDKIAADKKEEQADDYTSDDDFSGKEVAAPLSRMTARHLAFSNIFERVDPVDVTTDDVLNKKFDHGSLDKYDVILVGRIKHFVGYFHRSTARNILFLPLGGTGFAINSLIPTDVKANASLDDVRLVSLKTGKELWKGSAEYKWDEGRSLPGGRRDNALISWRNAVNDLAKKLAAAKLESAQ